MGNDITGDIDCDRFDSGQGTQGVFNLLTDGFQHAFSRVAKFDIYYNAGLIDLNVVDSFAGKVILPVVGSII